jgi:hypothetical protein
VVVRTPPGHPPFAENAWVGRSVVLGDVYATVERAGELRSGDEVRIG